MLWRREAKRNNAREIVVSGIYSRRCDNLNAKLL